MWILYIIAFVLMICFWGPFLGGIIGGLLSSLFIGAILVIATPVICVSNYKYVKEQKEIKDKMLQAQKEGDQYHYYKYREQLNEVEGDINFRNGAAVVVAFIFIAVSVICAIIDW